MLASGAAHVAIVAALCLYPPPPPKPPFLPPPFARVALIAPPPERAAPVASRAKRVARLEMPPAPKPEPETAPAPLPEPPRFKAENGPALIMPMEQPKLEAPPAAPAVSAGVVRAAGFEAAPLQASAPPRQARLNVGSFHGWQGPPGGSANAGRNAEVRQGGFAGARAAKADGKPGPVVGAGGFGGAAVGAAKQPARPLTSPAGFSQVRAERAEAHPEQKEAKPDVAPVEILSKPKPAYTHEAREHRIEGEVVIETRFGADGRIEILRVVRGLGYGLDEAAAEAVRAMRFRPATRNGTPVDAVLSVSVAFRLAY